MYKLSCGGTTYKMLINPLKQFVYDVMQVSATMSKLRMEKEDEEALL